MMKKLIKIRAWLRWFWYHKVRKYDYIVNANARDNDEIHDLSNKRVRFCLKFMNLNDVKFIKITELAKELMYADGCANCFPNRDTDVKHKIIS